MKLELREKTALVAGEKSYTYAELWGLADVVAQSFPVAGEKVAIFSENSDSWLMALYGGWRAHNVMVPIDYLSTADELAYMVDDCQPALLCCSSKTLEVATKAMEQAKHPCPLFNLSTFTAPDSYPLATTPTERDNNDVALILYTSGTTGSPKGVILSFGNLQANLDAVCGRPIIGYNGEEVMGVPIYDYNSRCLILLPLHHILPLLGTAVMPLYNGGTLYICPTLSGEDICKTMCTHHITHMVGVPRLYALLCKNIKSKVMANPVTKALYKLVKAADSLAFSRVAFKAVQKKFGGSLRYCVCGGAALDPEIAVDLRVFGFEILEGYGMTEAAPMIAFTHPNGTRIGTAGQNVPGVEVTTIDGELVARGANIMVGYYNRPEETAAIMKDGWLHTGDLGNVSADGFVTITGRCKEILVLNNGKNVNPVEIEGKLELASPFIKEAAVMLNRGQLHALLVTDDAALAAQGVTNVDDTISNLVIAPYNANSSPAKKIMGYTIIKDELPRTRMGKIRRYQLATILAEVQNKQSANLPKVNEDEYTPEAKALVNYLNDQIGMPVHLHHHLELDLGLDSLDKVALLSFIQNTFGVECSEQVLASSLRVGQLADFVAQNKTKMDITSNNWKDILNEDTQVQMPKSGILHNILKFNAALAAKICFRLKLQGQANLPQKPVIIAANHQSYADGLLLSLLMDRRTFKHTVFLAKQKHFNSKFMSFIARHCNIIVMDINSNIKESMQKMALALKKGYNVCIFPEGTRSTDGEVADFKRSFAIVGSELNVPIVPAVIKGAEKAMPKGRIIPRPFSRISVSFLPPVEAGNKDYAHLTKEVQGEIADELHRAA